MNELDRLAERLEDSLHREIDRVSKGIEEHIRESRLDHDLLVRHDAAIDELRLSIAQVRQLNVMAHSTPREAMGVVAREGALMTPKQRRLFIAGIITAVMALASIANVVSEVISELLKNLKH